MTSMTGNRGPAGLAAGQNQAGGNYKSPQQAGYNQIQKFTPEQMQLFQSLFSHVSPGSYLSRLAGGDESMFQDIEAPAMKQFGELQGQLASRFSGMGLGGRHGSGFNLAANQATSDFAQQLQSQRHSLQQQAIQELMGMSNTLLGQDPYMLEKKGPSGWQKALGIGLPIAGAAVGGAFGGLPGAKLGGKLGSTVGQSFLG